MCFFCGVASVYTPDTGGEKKEKRKKRGESVCLSRPLMDDIYRESSIRYQSTQQDGALRGAPRATFECWCRTHKGIRTGSGSERKKKCWFEVALHLTAARETRRCDKTRGRAAMQVWELLWGADVTTTMQLH